MHRNRLLFSIVYCNFGCWRSADEPQSLQRVSSFESVLGLCRSSLVAIENLEFGQLGEVLTLGNDPESVLSDDIMLHVEILELPDRADGQPLQTLVAHLVRFYVQVHQVDHVWAHGKIIDSASFDFICFDV